LYAYIIISTHLALVAPEVSVSTNSATWALN
jgi:hypothetical protein